MKRIAVIGGLLLVLAMLAGPALAQSADLEGSVLPEQQERETLPTGGGAQPVASAVRPAAPAAQPALADTGIELSVGAVLAGGLLVLGGGALVLARRRAE